MSEPLRQSPPLMSVIMVTPDHCRSLRRTLKHLRAQSVADQLEIVIIGPREAVADYDLARELGMFHSHQFIEGNPLESSAAAKAAGILVATAPIVAMTEDHSFPARGWAAALIERHREPWAAVGPAMVNGNPQSVLSWTNMLIEYGPWVDPVGSEEREHLPPHNSSYKRDLLVEYADRLAALLDAETVLHWDLRARGKRLYLESAAKTRHFNFAKWNSLIPLRLTVGRIFAGSRSRHWSPARRILYALASPAIPLIRFARVVGTTRRVKPNRLKLLATLFVGFVIDGFGEMLGYALGSTSTEWKASKLEFHRERHLLPGDLPAFGE
jgi:hypothetical protein